MVDLRDASSMEEALKRFCSPLGLDMVRSDCLMKIKVFGWGLYFL